MKIIIKKSDIAKEFGRSLISRKLRSIIYGHFDCSSSHKVVGGKDIDRHNKERTKSGHVTFHNFRVFIFNLHLSQVIKRSNFIQITSRLIKDVWNLFQLSVSPFKPMKMYKSGALYLSQTFPVLSTPLD